MSFAICFDLPRDGHLTGDPYFAAIYQHGTPAIVPTLDGATRFEDEATAERFLESSFGPRLRPFGVVVQVDEARAAA